MPQATSMKTYWTFACAIGKKGLCSGAGKIESLPKKKAKGKKAELKDKEGE